MQSFLGGGGVSVQDLMSIGVWFLRILHRIIIVLEEPNVICGEFLVVLEKITLEYSSGGTGCNLWRILAKVTQGNYASPGDFSFAEKNFLSDRIYRRSLTV